MLPAAILWKLLRYYGSIPKIALNETFYMTEN